MSCNCLFYRIGSWCKAVTVKNACYYSVQNRVSSCLLFKDLKIKLYKTKTLSAALYGRETLSY